MHRVLPVRLARGVGFHPMAFDPTRLGKRVREERLKAGLSLAQLAAAAGVTKTYLVRLENQTGNPSVEIVAQIADALDLTVADLVGGPVIRYVGDDADVPPSLRAFADEANLTSADVTMLASIRWRDADRPTTAERWRYVHQSLVMSRDLERHHGEED